MTMPQDLCVHCSTPLTPQNRVLADNLEFCCQGCRIVYGILSARGLSQYYDLKKLGTSIRPALPAAAPLESSQAYSYMENEEFRKLYEEEVSSQGVTLRKMQFYLEGIHCVACVWLLEKLPEWLEGVHSVRLDLGRSVATVLIREKGFSQVATEFHRLGYKPHAIREGDQERFRAKEDRRFLMRTGVAGMATGNIMLLAVSLYGGAKDEWGELFRWVSFLLYLPVFFYSAVPFYRAALSAFRLRTISIDTPIVLGVLFGTVISFLNLLKGGDELSSPIYFDSLSALVFLLLASRYWLRRSQGAALSASMMLQFMTPSQVRRVKGEAREDISINQLQIGDSVEVRAGETIPADGRIEKGRSYLNCALLTGESQWVKVIEGEDVFAGTVNEESPLLIQVKSAGSESRLGQILKASLEGSTRKAPIVALTDLVSRYFVWGTLVLSGLVFGWVVYQGGGALSSVWIGLNRALAIVIVTCPCALALATPLTLSVALGRSARGGILIKSAEALERLASVREVFLDKTGTLTQGQFEVEEVILSDGVALSDICAPIVALEKNSAHPIAKALVRYFESRLARMEASLAVDDFREVIGQGVEGRIQGALFRMGRGGRGDEACELTEIVLERNDQLLARIRLGDPIREDSVAAISAMKLMGIEARIISGDITQVVSRVARVLGVGESQALGGLSPEGKSEIIRKHPRAAMVGDGANDSIALSESFVGVAVHGGVEVSLRVADVYLYQSGMRSVVQLLEMARESFKVVRRNLVFSIIYNIVGVAAALLGLVGPLFAAVLMPMSAATVFASSLWGTRRQRELFLKK